MNTLNKLAAIALAVVVLFSCNKNKDVAEAELTSFIPSESDLVLAVNTANLKTKGKKINALVESKISKQAEYIKSIMSSVDYAYLVATQKDEKTNVNVFLKVNDINSLTEGKTSAFKTPSGLDVYAIPDADSPKLYASSKDGIATMIVVVEDQLTKEEVGLGIDQNLTKPEKSLLDTDDQFGSVLSDKKDISFWTNGSIQDQEQLDILGQLLPLQSILKDLDTEGSVTTSTVDFEKGELLFAADYFGNENYNKIFKPMAKAKLEQSTIDQMKIENPFLVLTGSVDFKEVVEYLKEKEVDKEIDENLDGFLTTDELGAIFNGDILMAAGNLKTAEQDADIEVVLGLQDETKAQAFLDKLVADEMLEAKDGHYLIANGMVNVLVSIQGDALVIAKENTFGTALVKGEGKSNTKIADKLAVSSYIWLDVKQVMSDPMVAMFAGGQVPQLSGIESIEFTTKSDDESTGHGSIKFTDKEQNALDIIADMAQL